MSKQKKTKTASKKVCKKKCKTKCTREKVCGDANPVKLVNKLPTRSDFQPATLWTRIKRFCGFST